MQQVNAGKFKSCSLVPMISHTLAGGFRVGNKAPEEPLLTGPAGQPKHALRGLRQDIRFRASRVGFQLAGLRR